MKPHNLYCSYLLAILIGVIVVSVAFVVIIVALIGGL